MFYKAGIDLKVGWRRDSLNIKLGWIFIAYALLINWA